MIFRKQNNLFLASYFVPLKIWPIITARIFPHLKAEPIHQKSVFKFILFGFISSEVKNAVNLSTFSEFPVKQKFKAFLFLKSSYLFVCLSWGETNTSGNCLLIYTYFGGQECRQFVYIIGNFQSSRHSKYRLSLWSSNTYDVTNKSVSWLKSFYYSRIFFWCKLYPWWWSCYVCLMASFYFYTGAQYILGQ